MKPEIAVRWADELRSGKWAQARGHLGEADSNARCCLGVLCELAVAEGIISPPEPDEDSLLFAGQGGTLPNEVITWAGIKGGDNPEVGGQAAAVQNDAYHLSFDELADLIEAEAEKI